MKSQVLMATVAVCAGCAPVLVPSGSVVSAGRPSVAYTEASGVRVRADGTWRGDPGNLSDYVTPVLVTLENRSGHSLRLAYQDLTLLGATGVRYAALPPFSLQTHIGSTSSSGTIVLVDYHPAQPVPPRPVAPRPVAPRIHHHRFHVAPPYAHLYVGVPLWAGLWALGATATYHSHWVRAWPVRLPTEDMVERAMPEGALEDGGMVSGYLYFQNVTREASVQLQLKFHDAESGAVVATLTMPFMVRH